jgi:hypothetical protein
VKGVGATADGLHLLATYPTGLCHRNGQAFETRANPRAFTGLKLPVVSLGSPGESYVVRLAQPNSPSDFVRPRR